MYVIVKIEYNEHVRIDEHFNIEIEFSEQVKNDKDIIIEIEYNEHVKIDLYVFVEINDKQVFYRFNCTTGWLSRSFETALFVSSAPVFFVFIVSYHAR